MHRPDWIGAELQQPEPSSIHKLPLQRKRHMTVAHSINMILCGPEEISEQFTAMHPGHTPMQHSLTSGVAA
jgi:hypothetical protein